MKIPRIKGRSMTVSEYESLKDFASTYDQKVAEDIRDRYQKALDRKIGLSTCPDIANAPD